MSPSVARLLPFIYHGIALAFNVKMSRHPSTALIVPRRRNAAANVAAFTALAASELLGA